MANPLATSYPNLFPNALPRWSVQPINFTINQTQYTATVRMCGDGVIYNTDSKVEIWVKMVGIILIRIPMTVAKTLYHAALPLSMSVAIAQGIIESRGRPLNERVIQVLTRCGQNFVDIIKTPLVGIVLTILFAVGAILGLPLMGTNFLYEWRHSVLFPVIHFLWWNEKVPDILHGETACMTGIDLKVSSTHSFTDWQGMKYPDQATKDEKQFLHLAATMLKLQKPSQAMDEDSSETEFAEPATA